MGSITIMVTAAELLYTKTGIVSKIRSVHQLCRTPSNTVHVLLLCTVLTDLNLLGLVSSTQSLNCHLKWSPHWV